MSASHSSTTSKKSLSTLGFRENELRPAGILLDEIAWHNGPAQISGTCRHLRNFSEIVPADCPTGQGYIQEGNTHRTILNDPDTPIIAAKYAEAQQRHRRAEEMVRLAAVARDEPENRWHEAIEVGCADLLDGNVFKHMIGLFFDAQPHPLVYGGPLPTPKPDYAIGFQLSRKLPRPTTVISDPFSSEYIAGLKNKQRLYLQPHVNTSSQSRLIYPFFCFEAKSSLGSSYAAANQLANDLSFALGILLQLRKDVDMEDEHPLHVFGATSSGSVWTVYVAWESERTAAGYNVCVSDFWLGDIKYLEGAVEFIAIMQKIRAWALQSLQPLIRSWLQRAGVDSRQYDAGTA